jgi:hypothetical protein
MKQKEAIQRQALHGETRTNSEDIIFPIHIKVHVGSINTHHGIQSAWILHRVHSDRHCYNYYNDLSMMNVHGHHVQVPPTEDMRTY